MGEKGFASDEHFKSFQRKDGKRSSANRSWGGRWCFEPDDAFAKPEIYEALEERGVKYAIRLPADDSLLRDIEEPLRRPVGRRQKWRTPLHGVQRGSRSSWMTRIASPQNC